jgi:hypothetical protein
MIQQKLAGSSAINFCAPRMKSMLVKWWRMTWVLHEQLQGHGPGEGTRPGEGTSPSGWWLSNGGKCSRKCAGCSLGWWPFVLSDSDATSRSGLIVRNDGVYSVGQPQSWDARLVLDDPRGKRRLWSGGDRENWVGGRHQ